VAVLCSKEGVFGKCRLEEEKGILEKIEMRHKLNGVKAIYAIKEMHFAVFTRGTVLIYNQDFSQLQKQVEVSPYDTIFSVDCWSSAGKTHFAFLTKSKETHAITFFEFNPKTDFPLELKKKVEEIGDHIKRFEVSIYYPKKFAEKLKNNPKASMSLKLLSASVVVLTGKFGEVVTIDAEKVQHQSTLQIKPYSYQEGELAYSCWLDSHHYKEIYCIYRHLERLYLISTDHNLTIWQLQPPATAVKYLYAVKFLTAPVQFFFRGEKDPRTAFALLKDSAIRSFTPLEEGSHQINEYWKFSKKYRIRKAVLHPNEEGVVGLATECHRVQLYDIFEDRLMKLVEVGEEILNISFELPSVEKELEGLFKFEAKEQSYPCITHFLKEMEDSAILLVQTKNKVIFIHELAQKEPRFTQGPRTRRLERIHDSRFWDSQLLLASNSKQNQLELHIRYEGQNIEFSVGLSFQGGRVLFRYRKEVNDLEVFNFKGNKFTLTRVSIVKEPTGVKVEGLTEVLVGHQIDYLSLNGDDQRVAIYSQREDVLAILHMQLFLEERYVLGKQTPGADLYQLNSKLETLAFYLEHHLLLGTKDQTIKVVDLRELPHLDLEKKAKRK
jgi:hypothetical protein